LLAHLRHFHGGVRQHGSALAQAWLVRLVPGLAAEAELLTGHLAPVPGGRLLDVGCGGGRIVENLRLLGWDATGLEPDEAAASGARALGIPVVTGSLPDARYGDGSLDAVVMVHVVEHLHDARRILGEVRRILRPGGTLVIVTPNPASMTHAWFRDAWLQLDPPRHLCLWSRQALVDMLASSGFLVERVRGSARAVNLVVAAGRSIRRQGGFDMAQTPAGRELLLAETVQQFAALLMALAPRWSEETIIVGRVVE